jgi:hypothetical protein
VVPLRERPANRHDPCTVDGVVLILTVCGFVGRRKVNLIGFNLSVMMTGSRQSERVVKWSEEEGYRISSQQLVAAWLLGLVPGEGGDYKVQRRVSA